MKEKTSFMQLTIIIPVYNESNKVEIDIAAADQFLRTHQIAGEILVVDDGSSDDTARVVQSILTKIQTPGKLLLNGQNKGKGYSVRHGVKESQGDYVLFADCGNCIDLSFALKGLDLIKSGQCEIAHASRKLPGSKIQLPQPFARQITSNLFRFYTLIFLGIPTYLSDTQCGFKMYRGDIARQLYADCRGDGFTFDIEVIRLALKMNLTIKEFPVIWVCDHDSRLRIVETARKVFKEFAEMKK